MKKLFIFSILSLTTTINAAMAINLSWWEQETVCRINTTKCYAAMGTGFETDEWDNDAQCRGMKYICPNAFKSNKPTEAKLVSRDKISTTVSSDFDANILSDTNNCFGVRKSNQTGSKVMLDGEYTNVWCHGILNNPIEETKNGEITNTRVTCNDLKTNGYIGVENGKCWGKPYNDAKYYIDCGDNSQFVPKQLIVLNGTEYSADNSQIQEDVQKQMKEMFSISKEQKAKYFK